MALSTTSEDREPIILRTETPPTVRLNDYTPYPFEIDTVALSFDLDPDRTRVAARLQVARKTGFPDATLLLDGEALSLISIRIDGEPLSEAAYTLSDTSLEIHTVPDAFVLETEVEIAPSENTALSGLYISGGRFCTQCEATGFRRITYWPDRPDVMSRFTVTMTADKAHYPILLSNGSPGDTHETDNGRCTAEWIDPHRKPSYLFALCAGDYDVHCDTFTTMSGKPVDLAIYVDKGDAGKALWAMDCLKRAMKWDEDVFGREYDLDVFNIVAVRDFNFGAMENKGLNIFNSAYVLADPATATDADFEAIESIVAHEYFHNWTGNRITCRDWFQLCLKEGLTVYRDQEFSADMRSRPVQRIKDVIRLRARQFPEDAGPLAHPVRPDSYGAIDNLYTATVYEKGAELIRMLRTLIGADAFSNGLQLYFNRHDGDAATIEDFYACFEAASGKDLSRFRLWYAQPGTPTVTVEENWNDASATLVLSLTQDNPAPGDAPERSPVPIPLAGEILSSLPGEADPADALRTLVLDSAQQELRLKRPAGTPRPAISLARGFSAPIVLKRNLTKTQLLELAAAETDDFNRWDLMQQLITGNLLATAYDGGQPDPDLITHLAVLATQSSHRDPAFAALLLRVPDLGELMLPHTPADPAALHTARKTFKSHLAVALNGSIEATLSEAEPHPFDPGAAQAGQRAWRAACMDLAAYLDGSGDRLSGLFAGAKSMTEQQAALSALVLAGEGADALATFHQQWQDNALVIDKWFALQARQTNAAGAATLAEHADFDLGNPNRVRALVAQFAMNNLVGFHDPSGAGHRFVADMVRKVDGRNPALSARLLTSFEHWRMLEETTQASAEDTLRALAKHGLSDNAADIVARALG